MLANPYSQYQNNAVLTASPGELTLMLYNGAIKFINKSVEAIQNKNYEEANTTNIQAQDIITELQSTLDMKYPISQEIDLLYTFVKDTLVEANISKDITKLQDVLTIVREFRDTWQQVIKSK